MVKFITRQTTKHLLSITGTTAFQVGRQFRRFKKPMVSKMKNKKLVKTSGTILVNKDIATVFDFFTNPANDKFWRTEINQSLLDGVLQPGMRVAEYSHLSKKAPNNLIELTCVQFDKNDRAVFETQNSAQFYEKSERNVKAISSNTTQVTYTVCFDTSLVKFALGFALPRFIIQMKAHSDTKKYLKQLKTQLESANERG